MGVDRSIKFEIITKIIDLISVEIIDRNKRKVNQENINTRVDLQLIINRKKIKAVC